MLTKNEDLDYSKFKLMCCTATFQDVNAICLQFNVFLLFSLLQRQNIPKDYKIPVHYIPKEEVRYYGINPQ